MLYILTYSLNILLPQNMIFVFVFSFYSVRIAFLVNAHMPALLQLHVRVCVFFWIHTSSWLWYFPHDRYFYTHVLAFEIHISAHTHANILMHTHVPSVLKDVLYSLALFPRNFFYIFFHFDCKVKAKKKEIAKKSYNK